MFLLDLKKIGYVSEEKHADNFNRASIKLKVVFDIWFTGMIPRH